MEEDEVWEVSWGNTRPGQTDEQRCPQGPGKIATTILLVWLLGVAIIISNNKHYNFEVLDDYNMEVRGL